MSFCKQAVAARMLWLLTINRTSNGRLVIETNSVANYNVGNNYVDFNILHNGRAYQVEPALNWNLEL